MTRVPGFSRLFLLAPVAAVLLVGCGEGVQAGPSAVTLAAMQGIVHGGPNPVIGGAITLYETQANAGAGAYGGAGKVLATATTGSYGQFSIDGSTYTCDANEYAYIVVTGGNTGGNATNNSEVMMAALGSCSSLGSTAAKNATQIYISEASTVAAAYALSNFIKVSGTSAQVVGIGAPVTNATPLTVTAVDAATGTTALCNYNATSLVTTTCTAQGLGHAFQNAVNLVNAVGFGSAPTGMPNTTLPNNSTAVVPASMINTLASLLQTCVNSAGGTPCTNLFNAAKPSGGATPTDTLSAMIDIAKNPTNNVATLYGLIPATPFYNPSIATPGPVDFSLAIFYTATSGSQTTATSPNGVYNLPVFLSLDIADNVYVMNFEPNFPNVTSSSTIYGSSYVDGMKFDGTQLFTAAFDVPLTPATNGFQVPVGFATDTLGRVWAANSNGSNSYKQPRAFDTGGNPAITSPAGTVEPLPGPTVASSFMGGIAVDASNNLIYSVIGTAAGGVFTGPKPSLGALKPAIGAAGTRLTTMEPNTSIGFFNVAIDANQNIWGVNPGSTSTTTGVTATPTVILVPNTGTASAPVYNVSNVSTGFFTTTYSTYGIHPNGGTTTTGVAIDGSANAWIPASSGLVEFTPTPSQTTGTFTVETGTGSPATTAISPTSPALPEFDGNGTLFFANYDATGAVSYIPSGSTTVISLTPCYAAGGTATTCDYTHQQYGGSLQVDSTGSIWSLSGNKSTGTAPAAASAAPFPGIYEIIGTAAPTWPQLSYGKPGVKP